MSKVCWCILLFATGFIGQTTDDVARLTPAISNALTNAGAASDPANQALVNDLLALANLAHRPSRDQVAGFVNAMRGAATGRQVSAPQATAFSRGVVDVLRGRGQSNFALASQIRTVLTALGVPDRQANLIMRHFLALGEAVRGPDDTPAAAENFLPRQPLK